MTVPLVRERLAALLANVSGVRRTFTQVPRTLERADLPAFVIFVGAAQYDRGTFGESMVNETRAYEAVLMVAEMTSGTEGTAEASAEAFIATVRDYCLGRRGAELESEASPSGIVYDLALTGDGGIVAREFPRGSGTLYAAIPFYFTVKDVAGITYHD